MSSQLNTVCPKILLGPTIDPETQTNVIEDRMKYKERGDWSFNNLIAFCSQIHVQIIDPISISTITTLYGHKSITTCVKWCPLSIKNGMERGNTNILASADESGIIIIWDIRLSKPIHVLDTGKNTGVISMKWLNEQQKYLLVLSASATLVCFNLLNQSRVWSKSFSEPIISFTINPFNKNMAAVASNTGRIYLISDLNVNSLPEKVEQKMKVGEVKDSNGNMVSNLKDIEFSPHNRDQLYLITRREVAIYDLNLKQVSFIQFIFRHYLVNLFMEQKVTLEISFYLKNIQIKCFQFMMMEELEFGQLMKVENMLKIQCVIL